MGRNIGKNINKNLSSNYSQKFIDHAKTFATDAIKASSKRAILKTAEATCYWIWNKITHAVTNEAEILREKQKSQ